MTNSNLVKKAFSAAVAATTILWSVGLSAFLPVAASAATFGDLIKGTTLSTVYYYGSDGQRYAFPNEKTYFSWYKDFSTVKTISDSQLASITLAGNIVYRPGARWIKITSDKKVYVVSTSGKVRWVENEATAKGLGGDNWNAHIDDVPDVFFTDYTVGDSLTSPAAGYDGMLWTDGTSKYLVSGGKYSKVSDAGFAANGYNAGFVLAGTGFTKSGLSAGADITAGMTNLTDAAQKVTTPTYAQTQNVTVALSASSPAASTLVAGQALANMLALDFTNPTSAAVSVKSLKLARTGVSSDSTLSNVYLFNGYTRLTDSATVSSGSMSWNDASGLFTIPAGGTVTVNVRTDVLASTEGQTIGIKLASAADVGFVGAFSAAGSYPIMGGINTIAKNPGTLSSVSFATTVNPTGDATPAPQNDYKVWENTVSVGNNSNGAKLYAIRFRNTGSINASDIKNWRLYVAGVQKGTAVAQQDANGYVTFDFSAAPVKLTTNNHTFKLLADIIGGTSRTVSVSMRSTADAVFMDPDYNQAVLVQRNSTTFSSADAYAQTIASGSLMFSKRTDSPAGNVTAGATNAALARYDVTATGEPMKIESLNFNWSDSGTGQTLRNGAVYLDGVQIGNTTNLCGDDVTTAITGCSDYSGTNLSYTTFNFGSSFVVYPGTPAILEVRADIYDAVAGGNITSGNITAQMVGTSTKTVLRKSTGDYVVPFTTGVQNAGNALTVKQGSLTLAKNTSYAAQSVVTPKVAFKVGSYTLTSSATEPISLTGFTVTLTDNDTVTTSDVSNLVLKYGTAGSMVDLPAKTSPNLAGSDIAFNLDYTLAPNKTINVDLYADIGSTFAADKTLISTLAVVGTCANSTCTADKGPVTGQTMTMGSGAFVPAYSGTPVNFRAAGAQTVVAGKYSFTASKENYTITDMLISTVAATAAAGSADIAEVQIWDDAGKIASAPFSFSKAYNLQTDANSGADGSDAANTAALVTGLSIPVAAGDAKTLTAKFVLNSVGTGNGVSQLDLQSYLDAVRYTNSQGAPAFYETDSSNGPKIIVTKGYPVVNQVPLANNTIQNGVAQDVYKFTVTANGGKVALKQFVLPISWSDGSDADTLQVGSFQLYSGSSDITSAVTIMSVTTGVSASATDALSGNTALTNAATASTSDDDLGVLVKFTTEDVIDAGATVTYTLRATPDKFHINNTSAATNNDSFSLYLQGDTATNATKTYLNDKQIASGGNRYQLTTTAASAQASSNNAAANFVWSDMSASPAGDGTNGIHTSSANGDSSGDWTNGFLVLNLDLSTQTWSK